MTGIRKAGITMKTRAGAASVFDKVQQKKLGRQVTQIIFDLYSFE